MYIKTMIKEINVLILQYSFKKCFYKFVRYLKFTFINEMFSKHYKEICKIWNILCTGLCVLKIIILIKRIIEWSKTSTVLNIEQGIPLKEINIVAWK